jgi:dGTPase
VDDVSTSPSNWPDVAWAHAPLAVGEVTSLARPEREEREHALLAPGATRSSGAGSRARAEDADPNRTCFERDLDRIQHSRPFRRLAGKCQVYLAPDDDHLRTRLTHAIEVGQVATSIARATRLNEALTLASALGHDCGHGPAGHASEDALSPYLEGGYHHAVYGADVVLEPLNLCAETLDAVRNHSWNRPAPMTPEGEVVAWAAMVETIAETGRIGMRKPEADALAAFRAFNYERIYLRPESVAQADRVNAMLRQLTEWFIENPRAIGAGEILRPGSTAAAAAAVRYVSGMTDRFALRLAVDRLGWSEADLPTGV